MELRCDYRADIRTRAIVALAFIVVGLGGCATRPAAPAAVGPVFYPPLPNPPRIQYLATFSSERDLAPNPGGFARFVLGKETANTQGVNKPYGVALHDGKLYVVDTRAPGYAVFDLVAQRFVTVSGSGGGKMKKPINITIDRDGTKYVTDTGRNQVLVYDREDRYVRAYGTESQFKPVDVAIADDRIYVTDIAHHAVAVLDKASGRELARIGKVGSKDGELYHPTNLALADGYLYVADTGNYRVQKFALDGAFVRSYGSIGTGLGQFARPKGIALDPDGRLYVIDAAFENIQVFDPDGTLLLFFGEPGERRENINLPAKVTIDAAHVTLFQRYADPKFKLQYVILVASQFGTSKVNVYGFGKLDEMDYSVMERAERGP